MIVELANHSLQNLGKGVLTLTKNLLIGRTKILFALTTMIHNHHRDGHRQQVERVVIRVG